MIPENMLTTAGLIAGAAALGAFWSQAKNIFRYLSGFVSLQKTMDSHVGNLVYRHLRRSYRRLPSGISYYDVVRRRVDRQAVLSYVAFDLPNPQISVWWGPRGFFIVTSLGQNLLGFRGLSDPQGLVTDALEFANNVMRHQGTTVSNNFRVCPVIGSAGELHFEGNKNRPGRGATRGSSNIDDKPVDSLQSASGSADDTIDTSFMFARERYVVSAATLSPLEGLHYPQEVHDVLSKLQAWYQMQDWYAQRSIPWRTGVLLHGPGGTGKSSLSLVIAKTLGLPIYQFFLNTLTDKEFISEWQNMAVPCVVALEDFDTAFEGRTPVTVHKSLSFEAVLNQISGINSLSGVVLVVTTNHLDKVDPALGRIDPNGKPTRPGRIDHILYMGTTTRAQRQAIAAQVLTDWPELQAQLIIDGNGATAAQFQAMCVQTAVDQLYKQ